MQRRHAGKNIPIELLRCFVTITELGSFTKAAQELNLTQSAISGQVKRLEQLIAADIFVKSARGIGLSERGQALDRYARRILALNDQIISMVGGGSQGRTIRVGIQTFFAVKLLRDVITRCTEAHSSGRVQFICDSSATLRKQLTSGYLDLLFALAPSDLRLYGVAEWKEPLVWSSAPTFRLTPGLPIPLIVLPNGFIDNVAIQAIENEDLPYSVIFSASDMTARTAAAAAGIGVMAVPERVLPEGLVAVRNSCLPELPQARAGIYAKEGLDIERIQPLATAFMSAVCPASVLTSARPHNGKAIRFSTVRA